MRDPIDINARARQAAVQQAAIDAAIAQELDDMRWLMAHKQGRRIAWRILQEARTDLQSFTGNSETFFNEGKRSVGRYLKGKIEEASEDAFFVMKKENKDVR